MSLRWHSRDPTVMDDQRRLFSTDFGYLGKHLGTSPEKTAKRSPEGMTLVKDVRSRKLWCDHGNQGRPLCLGQSG